MMSYRTSGMIVAVPTLGMAAYITLITFKTKNLFLPNLAVLCWICANITWMVAEFYNQNFTHISLSLFVSGIIVIAYYFARVYKRPETPAP